MIKVGVMTGALEPARSTLCRVADQFEVADIDVLIVGAGFAGLCMANRTRTLGLSVRVIEAGAGVGGTWYWNRYPGARCDIESLEYSYSFDHDLQQEWEWTERYATQPEILKYLDHVADRFDLRSSITFKTRVTTARFDEQASLWCVETDAGEFVKARFIVMATGCLSSTNTPAFAGIDQFAGELLHTGKWPHEHSGFRGKRVAVIGTGSSAIQTIPIIAGKAEHLTVFQRTANYAVPAHNQPLDATSVAATKARYDEFRADNKQMTAAFGSHVRHGDESAKSVSDEERIAELESAWAHGGLPFLGAYNDVLLDAESNDLVAEFVRDKVRSIVDDAAVAELLVPTTTIGCKRMCVDTGYYETFNRSNVELVDLNLTPIDTFTESGITVGGVEHEFDAVVLATGFDAMTGTLSKIEIVGRAGLTLNEAWAAGPATYLGISVAGFPNLFLVTGPGSPSVLTNMIVSIEHHVDWISECIRHLDEHEHRTIEALSQAQQQWVEFVNAVAAFTLFPTCNSWYLGANVPGKTRVFMPLPGFPGYVEQCAGVVADGYRGFELV